MEFEYRENKRLHGEVRRLEVELQMRTVEAQEAQAHAKRVLEESRGKLGANIVEMEKLK